MCCSIESKVVDGSGIQIPICFHIMIGYKTIYKLVLESDVKTGVSRGSW